MKHTILNPIPLEPFFSEQLAKTAADLNTRIETCRANRERLDADLAKQKATEPENTWRRSTWRWLTSRATAMPHASWAWAGRGVVYRRAGVLPETGGDARVAYFDSNWQFIRAAYNVWPAVAVFRYGRSLCD